MSDFLTDEEQVERLRRWWEENGTSLVISVVVVVAAVIGWRWWTDYEATRAEAASMLYQQYMELRDEPSTNEGRLNELTARLDEDYANSAYRTFSLLFRAHDAVAAGNLEQAVVDLSRVIESTDDAYLDDLARVRLARVRVQQDKPDEALAVLAKVRGEGFRARAAEIKGDILLAGGDRAGALESYRAALNADVETSRRQILEMKLASARTGDDDA